MFAAMFLAALFLVPAAFAANDYFSLSNDPTVIVGPNGYDQTNSFWNTTNEAAGPLVAFASGNVMIFGTNASDFNGSNYTIDLDGGNSMNSVTIGGTNTVITFIGTANTHLSASSTWSVTNGSTLVENDTRHNGLNMNNEALTLTGAGTINFQTPMGANDNNTITENMAPGGVVNFQQASDVSGQPGFTGKFVLTAGMMNFATAQAAAQVFDVMSNTFSINGGTVDNTSGSPQVLVMGTGARISIGGNFTFAGSSSFDFNGYAVTNTGNHSVTVNANTLAIGGVISGSGNGLTKLGNGTLSLYGANTYSGTTLVGAGTLAITNGGSIASSPLVLTNSTLDITALTSATTVPSLSASNSTLNVNCSQSSASITTTTLSAGGTANTVNIAKLPFVATFPTTFHIISASAVNGTLNFTLGTLPSTPVYEAYISNNVANNSVDLVITNGPQVNLLTWTGTNAVTGLPDGTWDVDNTETWQVGGVATNFNQNDVVTFDDSATGLTTVNVTGGESPSVLIVSNNALSYTFTNNGISDGSAGGMALNKYGAGTLLLQENNDSFTGGINVNAGAVILDQISSSVQGGATIAPNALMEVGLNDNGGVLPTGSLIDNGTLLFNQTNNLTVSDGILGDGVVEQFNTNIVTLTGASSGGWSVVISNGTLQAANNDALGSLPGGSVTVTNGGTFDVGGNTTQNNANFGTKRFIIAGAGVGGNGAIVNSANAQQQDAFQNVVLAADATIGGADRWDLRNGTPLLDLAGHTLTKTNNNQVSVVSGHVTSGNIIIQQGVLSFEVTPNFDPSAGTILVNAGAYVGQYKDTTNSFTRSIVLNGGGTTNLSGAGGVAFLDAPILLTADSSLNSAAGTEIFNGVISDGGSGFSLTDMGQGTNLLAGIDTYSGNTIIAGLPLFGGATLALTNHGSIANSPVIVVTNGSTFDISGLAAPFSGANVLLLGDDVQGGGTLVLGNTMITSLNSLSVTDATISLAITNPTPTAANITLANLNFGDTFTSSINITALPQLLSPGQYPLIKYGSAAGTYNLSLGNIPAGFSATLVNNTANNSIDLQVTAVPTGVWNGGGSPDFNWTTAANWRGTPLTGNDSLLFMGTTGLNNTNDTGSETAQGITFASSAGAFILNGNPVTLTGGITNNSVTTETINLGLSFSAPQLFNAGNGVLIIGGGLTNASSANTNILTLAGKGILTNLLASVNATGTNTILLNSANANWSLMDNGSSIAITNPWVLNEFLGTFNFGTATSAPNLTTTTVNGGPQDNVIGSISGTSTLNMSNGVFTTSARFNTGVNSNSTGIVNQYGGTLNMGSQFQGANGNGGSSVVNISGGVMNIGSATNPASPFYVASRGPGTLTVGGTGVLNCGTLDVSRSINSSIAGTVNLDSGGTIVASLVGTATANSTASATGSTGTFNFDGGILRALNTTNAVSIFFTNTPASPSVPLSAVVKAGGALIDSGTNSVIFAEALVTDPLLAGAQDGGLTKLGNGTLVLNEANTYNGNTVVSDGTLALSGAGSIASSTNIVLGGGVTFDVSAATFALGSSQVISNSGSTALIGGNADLSIGTLSLTYVAGVPSLSSTNGTLTLAGTTALQINNTGAPLPAGTYTIIANTTGGAVAGTVPSSFTVTGGGIASGNTASLQISGGVLNLVVGSGATPPPPKIQHITFSGGNIIITGTNNSGTSGTYHVLTSTNLMVPLANWTVLTNGTFDGSGNFAITNAVAGNGPHLFYILQVP